MSMVFHQSFHSLMIIIFVVFYLSMNAPCKTAGLDSIELLQQKIVLKLLVFVCRTLHFDMKNGQV